MLEISCLQPRRIRIGISSSWMHLTFSPTRSKAFEITDRAGNNHVSVGENTGDVRDYDIESTGTAVRDTSDQQFEFQHLARFECKFLIHYTLVLK